MDNLISIAINSGVGGGGVRALRLTDSRSYGDGFSVFSLIRKTRETRRGLGSNSYHWN